MRVQCPSCQRWVRLGPQAAEKSAGRTVSCPGCAAPIEVPAVDPDKPAVSETAPLPAPAPAGPAETPPAERAVEDQVAAAGQPQAAPTHEVVPPQPPLPGESAAAEFSGITVAASRPRKRAHHQRQAGPSRWRQLAANRRVQIAAGGTLAIVGLILLAVWLFSGEKKAATPEAAGKTPIAARKTAKPIPSRKSRDGAGIVEFQVDDEARRNIAIDVDGTPIFIRARGALDVRLSPGMHQIVLRRRGFQQQDVQLQVREGERTVYEPKWEPIAFSMPDGSQTQAGGAGAAAGGPPGFDVWLQDFDAAKRQAAKTNKDILVLFDGSDWCPYSVQMANELFFDPRFQSQVAGKYVLVFVDFPRGDEAKAKVQDADRNRRLMEAFGVEGFPTVVVADKAGMPYGRLGYEPGGVDRFLDQATDAQKSRDRRDGLIEEVRLSLGAEKAAAAWQTFRLLAGLQFVSHYADLFQKWYDESQQWDAANAQGYQEAFFEIAWFSKIAGVRDGDRQPMEKLVAELDAWKRNQDFKDANRGARMHLQAAVAMRHDVKAVERYAEAGLGYQATDPKIREMLAALQKAAPTLNVLSSGSGFVVGEGGYILTNRHVTEGEGRLAVRLPQHQDPVPAEVVATDSTHDLALVRVQVPEGISLPPLAVGSISVSRGTRVAAFGYPLGDLVGKGIKLTTGIISATEDQTDEGMLLLDCRINPGNSGGPLCNAHGEVVGIVAAKSYSNRQLDSYGLAVPAVRIVGFLEQHLPDYTPASSPAEGATEEWDAVDRMVSPSVLMLQRLREEN